MKILRKDIRNFQNTVWKHYKAQGRHHLPWRRTKNPYRILVSEVMLQQTQVERVTQFYTAWMKQFRTARALADAPLSSVLKAWQGLGYNRRAKMLHEAAQELVRLGSFPKTPEALERLRGVGPYTARAVLAFAYNTDAVFIETNIRTVIMHHFFARRTSVISDTEILEILETVLPKGRSREWHAALMDYGAYLKKNGVRLNAKAKGYAKQPVFAGSARQARGAILKELAKAPAFKKRLRGLLGDDRTEQMEIQLRTLVQEGMVEKNGARYTLPL